MSADPLILETIPGRAPGIRILRLAGPVTINGIFDLQRTLRADPSDALVLDLTSVPYMDSAAMGAIITHFVSCQRQSKKLVIAGVNGRVMELFRLTKVDGLLTLKPTVEEAEEYLTR